MTGIRTENTAKPVRPLSAGRNQSPLLFGHGWFALQNAEDPKCFCFFRELCCSSTSSSVFFFFFHSILKTAAALLCTTGCTSPVLSIAVCRALSDMKLGLAALLCLSSLVWLSECTPPTCYSRALNLSKEIKTLLDKIHTFHRTVSESTFVAFLASWWHQLFISTLMFAGLQKTCAEILPTIFLDVHVSCYFFLKIFIFFYCIISQ